MTKASIRQKIWDHLENKNLAAFPRPVHRRIPNFVGSSAAAEKVHQLEVFHKAKTVKVNPDKPQQDVRFYTLEARKTLLVPTPRLRAGLFNQIMPPGRPSKELLRRCSSREGVVSFSRPVGLEANIKVDLIVVGSVAVSKQGYRIGKGEGYADMEYAMMVAMGAVNADTTVVTTVHDCQVYDSLPEELFSECDLTVDIIVTPTSVFTVEPRLPKPKQIIWSLLTSQRLQDIPVLKILREKQRRLGHDVTLKKCENSDEETQNEETTKDKSDSKRASFKLFVGGIPARCGIKDMKVAVKQRGVNLTYIEWVANKGYAFITCTGSVEETIEKLQELSVAGRILRIEQANKQNT